MLTAFTTTKRCTVVPSGSRLRRNVAVRVAAPEKPAEVEKLENAELKYFSQRAAQVHEHFQDALGIDDFIARTEIALCSQGFRGENSIACSNLCRDESTGFLKSKIDSLFGSSFNINGLGAVLTCGCTGIGAGLSHSPVCGLGKERYVFFSFPHIGIDSNGVVGSISRPGRAASSAACGALIAALAQIKESGLDQQVKKPGVHDPLDPEFSILKQRLARRIRYEGLDIDEMDLVEMTKVAERMITNDLEFLISKAVDTGKADYAVITGVQIHNWGNDGTGAPTLEFIQPTTGYCVIDGRRIDLDLQKVPALTPRQMAILANATDMPDVAGSFLKTTTAIETKQTDPAANMYVRADRFDHMIKPENRTEQDIHEAPAWAASFSESGLPSYPDGANMEKSSSFGWNVLKKFKGEK